MKIMKEHETSVESISVPTLISKEGEKNQTRLYGIPFSSNVEDVKHHIVHGGSLQSHFGKGRVRKGRGNQVAETYIVDL